MIFGLLLIVLGVGTYFAAPADQRSLTAFIPSVLGVVLVLCGIVAQSPSATMHAIHTAAFMGLLGVIAPTVRIIRKRPEGLALFAMASMATISLIFLIFCVRSFIKARRQRGFDVTPAK